MAAWELCDGCRREYENPLDRRHHAQPTACHDCGPAYFLLAGEQRVDGNEPAIREAARRLAAGEILAVKGIGGYHLACDARNVAAVTALRTRKYRKEKPFALLLRTLDEARRIVELTAARERLLLDVARPIVLSPAKVDLPEVAPGNVSLGVMLPHAPLHHLLFEFGAPSPLVLTSANRSSEPIAYRDDDALERLAGIADAFLIGQRPIARRVDDSVVSVRAGKPLMVRRSRGYAPGAVCSLPGLQPILALGADLKNAVALVVQGEVFVSQHIGDLGDRETNEAFEETVRDLLAMYEIQPAELTVVHDLHPQFHSTRFAATLPARRRLAVQHHHAHVASALAEHGLFDERVVGVAFDGTGYGEDGSIWGGEVFVGSLREGFQRTAWLRPVGMPGGDAAARFPVQAAAGFLASLENLPDLTAPPFEFPARFMHSLALIKKNVRCFPCSSVGRLFDAVAALLGFTREATFEGQAAIWLEQQALAAARQPAYPFPDLDFRPLLQAVLRDRIAGRPLAEIASAFHAGMATGVGAAIRRLCGEHRLRTVALSGGVFQNELLFDWLCAELEPIAGMRIVTNSQMPVNDGGICLGQAALAALRQTDPP
jgi:hydrogenase maturation protein HypF